MLLSHVKIVNFRSIKSISFEIDRMNVFIGANNSGKTAILDAIRIGLSRQPGNRSIGFTEHDIHLPKRDSDPRDQPPISITLSFMESAIDEWNNDQKLELDEVISLNDANNLRIITLQAVYQWNSERERFESSWHFLNPLGQIMSERRNNVMLSSFFNYLPLFYLDPLRDIRTDFRSSNSRWTRLLQEIQIPAEVETEVLKELEKLDEQIITADPRFSKFSDTIGEATAIAMGEKTGSTKLTSMPQTIHEVIERIAILMQNENLLPWLPISNQGQGLQSLSSLFLLKAIAEQNVEQSNFSGIEPLFALEEPEAHLHPHAARTLWTKIQSLHGQHFMTSHSPYFIQNIPVNNLKLVRRENGQTTVQSVPSSITSTLPWNERVETLSRYNGQGIFVRSIDQKHVKCVEAFSDNIKKDLKKCYRDELDYENNIRRCDELQKDSQSILKLEEIKKFASKGQRKIGEIFFARKWVLVEGESDYLLFKGVAKSVNCSLDDCGVSVIDFQNLIGVGVFLSVATALQIPWFVITDNDSHGIKLRKKVFSRGFSDDDLANRWFTMDEGNDLEKQILSDGNIEQIKEAFDVMGYTNIDFDDKSNVLKKMKERKVEFANAMCSLLEMDLMKAEKMPKSFLTVLKLIEA